MRDFSVDTSALIIIPMVGAVGKRIIKMPATDIVFVRRGGAIVLVNAVPEIVIGR